MNKTKEEVIEEVRDLLNQAVVVLESNKDTLDSFMSGTTGVLKDIIDENDLNYYETSFYDSSCY